MELAASPTRMRQHYADSQLWPLLSFIGYNAVLLAVVLFSDFHVYDLLVVIFLELCVIGCFAWLRLATAVLFGKPFDTHLVEVSRGSTILLGTLLGGFFIFKFGLLMLALGVVLLTLPSEDLGFDWGNASDLHPLVELCLWVLLVRYAIMYVWSTLIKGDYKDVGPVRLLLAPYLSGIWVFITIGIGAFLAWRYPESPLLLFTLGIFAAKLVLDLFSLLLELRRVRLAPLIEARRRRRQERQRKFAMWLARAFVSFMTLVIVGSLLFAGSRIYERVDLENKLAADGVIVTGTIAEKEMSPGSSNSSPSYTLHVTYTYDAGTYTNRYWIGSSRYEDLAKGDAIEVTILPEAPRQSQLTEFVGKSISGRGWVPIRD